MLEECGDASAILTLASILSIDMDFNADDVNYFFELFHKYGLYVIGKDEHLKCEDDGR